MVAIMKKNNGGEFTKMQNAAISEKINYIK